MLQKALLLAPLLILLIRTHVWSLRGLRVVIVEWARPIGKTGKAIVKVRFEQRRRG
jgi:hypothetical protein